MVRFTSAGGARLPGRSRARWCIGLAVLTLIVALGWASSRSAAAHPVPTRSGVACAPSGAYVLSRAGGGRPPVPFALAFAGQQLAGTVNSAHMTLAPNGTYSSTVVVHWTNVPIIPIPGIQAGAAPDTLHGTGHYVVQHDSVVFTPDDWIFRQLTHAVTARASDTTLTLLDASGGLAGSHMALDAEFSRVH